MSSLVVAWIVLAAAIVIHRWREGRGMGLVVAFVVSLTSLHWLAATLYVMPWYTGLDRDDVGKGLQIAFVALVGFGIGVVLMSRALRSRRDDVEVALPAVTPRIGLLYVGVGVLLYGAMLTPLRNLPSIGGLASAGSSAAIFGLCLLVWHARPSRRLIWLAGAGLLPLVTIVTQGYLSYGIAALVMVVAFVAEWHRPRWVLLVAGVLLSYVAMSFYVTYMRDRREIREAVWNGATVADRLAVVTKTLGSIELFDPFDDAHLARVDDRLNQNYLVGRAAVWIGNGFAPYGHGTTLVDAALALVPRVFWPDKVVAAGSGDLVSQYTGMQFAEDTSVGIGEVMEFYVNFGTIGVLLGFVVLGGVVLLFDERAGWHLRQGNVQRACLWYLPGLSLLQVGGSFVDVTATMLAALACGVLANSAHGVLERMGGFQRPRGVVTHDGALP
ncbi:MAG: hypothetical protein ABI051_05540 [Vicinamibacterales bacterium]